MIMNEENKKFFIMMCVVALLLIIAIVITPFDKKGLPSDLISTPLTQTGAHQ